MKTHRGMKIQNQLEEIGLFYSSNPRKYLEKYDVHIENYNVYIEHHASTPFGNLYYSFIYGCVPSKHLGVALLYL